MDVVEREKLHRMRIWRVLQQKSLVSLRLPERRWLAKHRLFSRYLTCEIFRQENEDRTR